MLTTMSAWTAQRDSTVQTPPLEWLRVLTGHTRPKQVKHRVTTAQPERNAQVPMTQQ